MFGEIYHIITPSIVTLILWTLLFMSIGWSRRSCHAHRASMRPECKSASQLVCRKQRSPETKSQATKSGDLFCFLGSCSMRYHHNLSSRACGGCTLLHDVLAGSTPYPTFNTHLQARNVRICVYRVHTQKTAERKVSVRPMPNDCPR